MTNFVDVIIEQLINQVNMRKEHPSTTISGEAESV